MREDGSLHSRNKSMNDILNKDLPQHVDLIPSLSSLKYLHTKPLNRYFEKKQHNMLDMNKIQEKLKSITNKPTFQNETLINKDITFDIYNEEMEGLYFNRPLHQSFDANKSANMLITAEK